MSNRKQGKQEGELKTLHKEEVPLDVFCFVFLGPFETTSKMYKHIFWVIDSFTKFCWIYSTKSTSSKDAIEKLESLDMVFGNPSKIISDRGKACSPEEFKTYCQTENIQHHLIATGLLRANGEIGRLNSIIVSVSSKLSADDPTK